MIKEEILYTYYIHIMYLHECGILIMMKEHRWLHWSVDGIWLRESVLTNQCLSVDRCHFVLMPQGWALNGGSQMFEHRLFLIDHTMVAQRL